jgi:hypothetical protein
VVHIGDHGVPLQGPSPRCTSADAGGSCPSSPFSCCSDPQRLGRWLASGRSTRIENAHQEVVVVAVAVILMPAIELALVAVLWLTWRLTPQRLTTKARAPSNPGSWPRASTSRSP